MPPAHKFFPALLVALFSSQALPATPAQKLITIAERSGFQETGRYDEVEKLCAEFQRAWPKQVRCVEFGRTPQGRTLLALIVSTTGQFDPAAIKRDGQPVVMMQGAIHAGEVDGKDAGFLALRQMLQGSAAKGALERVTFVFVPVLNVDGHERFGRWNRPNQVGPEAMGWRTTAQNFNLNRDYTKADAPEMQSMLRLLNEWDPILYADLHVTDGADFEHDISYLVSPTLAGDEGLRQAGIAFQDELLKRMSAQGSLPIDFYPSLVREDDPMSGFAVSVAPARFSTEYWARRNRIGVLVETHSWKDYPTRVRATRNSIIAMLELAAAHGRDWIKLAAAADARGREIGGTSVPLVYENTEHVQMLDFKGYEYTRKPSAISGALVTSYDSRRPRVWHIPLKDEVRPALSVTAPRGGYVIPAAHAAWMRDKFVLHDIDFKELPATIENLAVQTFRARDVTFPAVTFEGHTMPSLTGEWREEKREVSRGSLFVPIAQAKWRLLMTLMEPGDPDSFVRWGFFNTAFERKEYMEAYVAEAVAQEMLASDPAIRAEFERKLSEDPAFAQSPAARLDFFYRRHASWDERFNLYPIYRVEKAL